MKKTRFSDSIDDRGRMHHGTSSSSRELRNRWDQPPPIMHSSTPTTIIAARNNHPPSSSSSSSAPASNDDNDFSLPEWSRYERSLSDIFFKRDDYIQKYVHAEKLGQFVEFYEKYRHFKQKQQQQRQQQQQQQSANNNAKLQLQQQSVPASASESTSSAESNNNNNNNNNASDHNLPASIRNLPNPQQFDSKYKINFTIETDERILVFDSKCNRDALTEKELSAFRKVLHMFEDFEQKRKFKKLVKLVRDRQNLPIAAYKEEIVETVRRNQVTVLIGDTGCGKSTQVCQYLLEAGFTRIAVTQPRRISAMSLCRRVSTETLNEYGTEIAYQIRFDTSKTSETKILFLTEGVLLRQIATDPLLSQYNVVIVDEAHERHLTCDFLFGLLQMILARRSNLKLVLMSATINAEMFSSYFAGAPTIQVPGRLYPIDVEYLPIEDDDKLANDEHLFTHNDDNKPILVNPDKKRGAPIKPEPYLRILERIDQEYPASERGDVLVFVSGINEINTLAEEMRKYAAHTKRWIILKLHSSLSIEEQEKVFDIAPDGVRKCIISTNIAETSVTIDGIRFVVDSGKVKEMSYDAETKMKSLQEYWISKASAEQRKGRAGRTGPGHCFRLYSRAEFNHFLDYAVPEILRTPLENIILQIKALNVGDPRSFPFIEKPSMEAIETAITLLKQHEALTDDFDESITPLGLVLSQIPVDIPIGKMLILGTVFDILDPIMTIAAGMSVQSPFLRVPESNTEAYKLRHSFDSDHGDPFTLLNVFNAWIQAKTNTARESSRKWCRRHGIEEQRLYEMAKLKQQFKDLLQEIGLFSASESGRRGHHGRDRERDRDSRYDKKRGRDNDCDYNEDDDRRRGGRGDNNKRRRRHGDEEAWKKLRRMQLDRERQTGKRVLKLDFDDVDSSNNNNNNNDKDSKEEEEIDLRHMDFVLSCDVNEFVRASRQELSPRDINLIKCILCSGFYPNFAIGDEGNSNRKASEQIYHTHLKPGLYMHPTSVFSGKDSPLSPSEILCYQTLLETNKSYLVNAFRAPAVHSLLLFAHSIDLNEDCDQAIIDDWLELSFVGNMKKGSLERLLTITNQLRVLLRNMLRSKLISKQKQLRRTAAKKLLEEEEEEEQQEHRHGTTERERRVMEAERRGEAQSVSITDSEDTDTAALIFARNDDNDDLDDIDLMKSPRSNENHHRHRHVFKIEEEQQQQQQQQQSKDNDSSSDIDGDIAIPEFLKKIRAQSASQDLSLASEAELSRKLAEFLELPVRAHVRRLPEDIIATKFLDKEERQQRLLQGPGAGAGAGAGGLDSIQRLEASLVNGGTGAANHDKKHGVQINEYLRFGSVIAQKTLAETQQRRERAEEDSKPMVSVHLRRRVTCQYCQSSFLANHVELEEHVLNCEARPKFQPQPQQQEQEEGDGLEEEEEEANDDTTTTTTAAAATSGDGKKKRRKRNKHKTKNSKAAAAVSASDAATTTAATTTLAATAAMYMTMTTKKEDQKEEEPVSQLHAPTPPAQAQASAVAIVEARRSYTCPNCDKTFVFTPTEQLRHKKNCLSDGQAQLQQQQQL